MLENIALIENLEDSKKVSAEIAEKMILGAETEKKINVSRESYRAVANRGSLMFFLLSENAFDEMRLVSQLAALLGEPVVRSDQ